ncbi:SAM-dependent methyltransferase [Polaribacter reichenbachii]|uniref:SAM-dependent methyltransferase n=1 Tax=Polaribacter reichenbachii TaxID=996801 RepID=A0A1B8TRR1_9FLAO|nr:class I SAM-dependent methyltransferase [Polaribacter reichenbachii]APZ44979.1 SAM-dependent methyltransferase [Polaribacter reichenbachii]AUC18842.1 SAM-dependent methyltransferase [Polaribacter reichenbachii]OBY62327.1 SAM-dependent methyltransferase [Polaribacter reichenbachii]
MKKNQSKKIKKPWPTKKIMDQIYDLNLWGGNETEFYSGFGSHNPELVDPYIKIINEFLNSFDNPISVLDLGCGDFNIGKALYKNTKKYTAIDVVEDLINYNKEKFKADNLEFKCLDIAKDELPKADCVFIRQVLQHLSNAEVENILNKLSNYKYLILTEHLPKGDFEPNKDIISGQGIRIKKQSGLDILKSPFNFKAKTKKELLSIDLADGKGVVVTWFFEVF